MKYYLDTEFIEGFHKPTLGGKKRHFIDLISIGLVSEDGREYYAISNEFNKKDADDWVKKNVISKLPERYPSFYDSPRMRAESMLYRNNTMIANDIQGFVYKGGIGVTHEFYGYYADYDWVLFCSLFGRMIDLPKEFPMYCRDLKQMMDENGLSKEWKQENCPDPKDEHNALADAKWNQKLHKAIMAYKNIAQL